MIDAIFSLRFALLLIGVVLIGVIYFWGAGRIRRNKRIKYDPRRARFEPQRRHESVPSDDSFPTVNTNPAVDGNTEAAQPIYAEHGGGSQERVPNIPVITKKIAAPPTEPVSNEPPTDPVSNKKTSQLELTFDVEQGETSEGSQTDSPPEAIIAVFVKAQDRQTLAGSAIERAMTDFNLRYGDMGIFHHYGQGGLSATEPLFSVANMVEPGRFDLENIAGLSTPGLAMFLRLPGPLDGSVTFELFLNTAQRLAKRLSAELYASPTQRLDNVAIDTMRQSAQPFAHGV